MPVRVRSLFCVAAMLGMCVPFAFADDIGVSSTDWPWWRGLNRNGVADANQTPPQQWDDEHNIIWKQEVPGRGHSSPTVVGDRIFLATADEVNEVQSVLCFDRETGKPLWKTDVHKGGFDPGGPQGNPRSTRASSTIASDGRRIFVNFINNKAVYTTALDMDGNQLWQQKVTDYVIHQGYGSSPSVYGPLVIVSADNKGGGAMKAFKRETGDVVWTVEREALPNYTSPIILNVDGSDQVVLVGHEHIDSFDPLNGKMNWEVEGATTECVTSVVTDGQNVVTSGGYPSNHISVVRADGSGKVIWRNGTRVYVPSLLVYEDHIYGVTDDGDAFCYTFDSEDPVWEQRLRAKFASSPVLVGDTIYALGQRGNMVIFKANPEAFKRIAENTIPADDVQATPAICGGRIYMRLARKVGDKRQEFLYCIGVTDE